ncbi:MAG: hypothetical protein KatS3mg008_1441 [Acidimicrobiales bacterium]|nr:MAG: hypothetical protein KatS3mg008_1441 [Acidimicrobiales bacterium]
MIPRIALVLVGVVAVVLVGRVLRGTLCSRRPSTITLTGYGDIPARVSAYLRHIRRNGLEQSPSSELPPLLLFTSPFCMRCAGVKKMLASEHRCFVEIDVAEHPDLARALGVRRVPTLFAMGSDGTLHSVEAPDLRSTA